MAAAPITLFPGREMRKSALEDGAPSLLLSADEDREARRRLRKADSGASMPSNQVAWVPQPISFAKLKSYYNPYHSRCVRIKARMTAGLGFEEDPGRGEQALPKSARGDSFESQVVLAAMDVEHTGNGYLEIITAAGGKVASATWLPSETMEIAQSQDWYRHTAASPGSSQRRVAFYPAWPAAPEAAMRYVLHFAQDGTWSTFYGEPDWLGALASVMLFDSAMNFNRAMFDNNCIPSWIILLVGAKLSDDRPADPNHAGQYLPSQREAFVDWLNSTYGGPQNAGKAMLMDGLETIGDKAATVAFQKLQEGQKDGDFLKLLDACRDHILSCHGVPPRLAGVVAAGSLGGSGEMFGQLLAFQQDIRPKQELLEQGLALLLPHINGAPKTLTLREMDIEPFRQTGSPPLGSDLPPDSSAAKVAAEVDRLLKEAGVR
jgi:hypothetical protein